MRRTSIIAAAIGSLVVASSSFAAFTFTQSQSVFSNLANVPQATFVDIFVTNDVGGDDGNAIQATELNYTGLAVRFNKPANAPVDLQNNLSGNQAVAGLGLGAEAGYIRNVGAFPEAGQTPALNDPSWSSLSSFTLISAVVGTAANANNPVNIMRLSYPVGVTPQGTLSGFIGGEVGSKVPFSITIGSTVPPTNAAPTIGANSGANVVFGQIVTTPLPFSGTVVVTDGDAGDTVALALGTLPSNVSDVTVTPSGQSPSGTIFTISGNISYVSNGPTNIPIIASDNSSASADTNGVFVVNVVPEPASLSALALGSLIMGRRRK